MALCDWRTKKIVLWRWLVSRHFGISQWVSIQTSQYSNDNSERTIQGLSIIHASCLIYDTKTWQTCTRLCLSMSDFHPESWNPMVVALLLISLTCIIYQINSGQLGLSWWDCTVLCWRKHLLMEVLRRLILFDGNVHESHWSSIFPTSNFFLFHHFCC